jgi:hypothetical protein
VLLCDVVALPPFDNAFKSMPNWSRLTPNATRMTAAIGMYRLYLLTITCPG